MKKLSFLILIATVIFGCKKESSIQDCDSTNASSDLSLPSGIGSQWIYEWFDDWSSDANSLNIFDTIGIIRTEEIDGSEYVVYDEESGDCNVWYRKLISYNLE